MNKNLIIAGIVAIIVIVGAVMFISGQQSTNTTGESMTEEEVMMEEKGDDVMMEDETQDGAMMEEQTVEIANFAYSPATITVKKGTKVVWTNSDSVEHTATADDGSFDTGLLSQGESGSITFDEAGTFTYHCTPHPNMKGTVVVEE